MKSLLLIFTFCYAPLMGSPIDPDWLKKASSNADEEAVAWLRKRLQAQEPVKMEAAPEKCINKAVEELSPPLYIFMSFSVPDPVWIDLSQELTGVGGVFVVRGIPENSFSKLAERVLCLKNLGLEADIQINPLLFEEYSVERVPKISVKDARGIDSLSGAVSLRFALSQMADKGETDLSKTLYRQLKGS